MSRSNGEGRINSEKQISALKEKTSKFEEGLEGEKTITNDKSGELETESEEAKFIQLLEKMRQKEVQWLKEKNDVIKHEGLLRKNFTEQRNRFTTTLQDLEKLHKNMEIQKQNFLRIFETQLEIEDQEFMLLEQEKLLLAEKRAKLENDLEEIKKLMKEKEKEIEQLSLKAETAPVIENRNNENHWMKMMDYKRKMEEVGDNLQQQMEQITKMQNSLKTQMTGVLQLEKDNALNYAIQLTQFLPEARNEFEFKNIYKIQENLFFNVKTSEKLNAPLKGVEEGTEYLDDKGTKNKKCEICTSSLSEEKHNKSPSLLETEV